MNSELRSGGLKYRPQLYSNVAEVCEVLTRYVDLKLINDQYRPITDAKIVPMIVFCSVFIKVIDKSYWPVYSLDIFK